MSKLRERYEVENKEKHLFDVVKIEPYPTWEYVKWLEDKIEEFESNNLKTAITLVRETAFSLNHHPGGTLDIYLSEIERNFAKQ